MTIFSKNFLANAKKRDNPSIRAAAPPPAAAATTAARTPLAACLNSGDNPAAKLTSPHFGFFLVLRSKSRAPSNLLQRVELGRA